MTNRYFGLSCGDQCSPKNAVLGFLWFGTFCNFIPFVGFLKMILAGIPISCILAVVLAVYNTFYIPTDIIYTYIFLWKTQLLGPFLKILMFVTYPLVRLIVPIVLLVCTPIAFFFATCWIPIGATYLLEYDYFLGGIKEMNKAAKWVFQAMKKMMNSYYEQIKRWGEPQVGNYFCIDIPILQGCVTLVHFCLIYVLYYLWLVFITFVISVISIPFDLWYTGAALVETTRIGPNLKFLFVTLMIPFFILWPLIVLIGALLFTTFGLPFYVGYLCIVATFAGYDKYTWFYKLAWDFVALGLVKLWKRVVKDCYKTMKSFWKFNLETYQEFLRDEIREFRLPNGQEPFDIRLIQAFLSIILGLICSSILAFGMFPVLSTIKLIPHGYLILKFFFYEWYWKTFICWIYNEVKRELRERNFVRHVTRYTKSWYKAVYVDILKVILETIGKCYVLVSPPLFFGFIFIYIPFMAVFPLLHLTVIVCHILYYVLLGSLGLTVIVSIPFILIISIPICYVVFWMGAAVGCFFYGLRSCYFSYYGTNIIHFFMQPFMFVSYTVYEIDLNTNDWFYDQEKSFVPCLQLNRVDVQRMGLRVIGPQNDGAAVPLVN